MKWSGEGDRLQAESPAGLFVVWSDCGKWAAFWAPCSALTGVVTIGYYRTAGAAKGACKRYAKRMAAAFKAMGKAGWQ